MIHQLRESLFPRIEFEQRAYRTRLAVRVTYAYFLLLATWLLALVALSLLIPSEASINWSVNLIGLAIGAANGAAALLLLRHDRVIAAGYLLALTMFVSGAVTVLTTPAAIHFASVTMILSTLLAGAIVSGGGAYLFATATILVTTVSWSYARIFQEGGISELSAETGLLFLLSVSVASLATAAILGSLSRQVQRTIERLHSQAQRLATLANTDPLTQLANRRYLLQQLEREFDRARRYRRPLSLLYLDLDGFKNINDRFGHLFGDDVLRGAAKAMRAVLRSTDLMARIGGDEFAVLMPETNLPEAKLATEKLRRALSAYSRQLDEGISDLSFCAGVSQISADDDSIEALLQRADEAQYLAKASGKARTMSQEDIA